MPELLLAESLADQSRECLIRALEVLDAHTTAPVRIRAHSSDGSCEVFELQEEFELGALGRRFLMSVTVSGRDALLIPLSSTAMEKK